MVVQCRAARRLWLHVCGFRALHRRIQNRSESLHRSGTITDTHTRFSWTTPRRVVVTVDRRESSLCRHDRGDDGGALRHNQTPVRICQHQLLCIASLPDSVSIYDNDGFLSDPLHLHRFMMKVALILDLFGETAALRHRRDILYGVSSHCNITYSRTRRFYASTVW